MPQDSNRTKVREKSKGRIWMPAFLCSLVATSFSLILDLLNAFKSLEFLLTEKLKESSLFPAEFSHFSQLTNCLLTYIVTFVIAIFLLDSAYLWRRISLFVIAITLTVSLSIAFAIWGYVFLPIILVSALVFCFILCLWYTSQHQMPCEADEYKEVHNHKDEKNLSEKGKTIPMNEKDLANIESQQAIKKTAPEKEISKIITKKTDDKKPSIPLPRVAESKDSNHLKKQDFN